MQIKTESIVLKVVKYGDTSIIVQCLTRESGIKSYMLKGVRSSKSRNKANCFAIGNILEMDVVHRPNKDLHFIKEFRLIHYFHVFGFDILKSSILMFMMEVIHKTIKEEVGSEVLFDAIKSDLIQLATQPEADANFHLHFLIRLSQYLGFMPEKNFSELHSYFDLNAGSFVGNKILASESYIEMPLSGLFFKMLQQEKDIKLAASERYILLEKLLLYFKFHLPNFTAIKSPQILHSVLAV